MIHYDPRWSGPHGIGRFSSEVISRLQATQAIDPGVPKLSLLDPVATTWALRRLRSGVYFTPGFNPPLRSPIPFAFCIYDLIHLHFAAESTLLRRAYYRSVVRPASRRANRIFTISQHSRDSILEWSGLPAERVQNVSCGVADVFRPEGPRYDAGRPYFLFVGRRGAHKNVARLLEAYAKSRCRKDVGLVFTGPPDADTGTLLQRHGLSAQVTFSDVPGDEQLAACYRGAVALVFPSLYEGFGLPVAEAMACGTPVLTSAAAALPETTGEGNALIVDPTRSDAIAEGLDRLADDPALRASLRSRGVARATRFTWDRVAGDVAETLRRAGG